MTDEAVGRVSRVQFPGFDGTVLRGELYRSAADGPVPGVVMTHGFSAVRTMALPTYARTISAGDLAVLLYDHRNLGDSDGEPRQEINPWAQSRDMIAALDWLGAQPEVDADRLGLWGSSFSGGESIVVAAADDRVRAVVANVPFAGLSAEPYTDTDVRFRAMKAQLQPGAASLADRGGDVVGPLAVVPEPGSGLHPFLDLAEATEWYLAEGGRAGTWRNQITLRNAFGSEPAFDPGVAAAHLAGTPLLMVIATEDRVADVTVARSTFDRAPEPKELVAIEGHHFLPYSGPDLTTAATAARDFLRRRL